MRSSDSLWVLNSLKSLLLNNKVWLPDDNGGGNWVVDYDGLMRDIDAWLTCNY
jgi:hypothetical protein